MTYISLRTKCSLGFKTLSQHDRLATGLLFNHSLELSVLDVNKFTSREQVYLSTDNSFYRFKGLKIKNTHPLLHIFSKSFGTKANQSGDRRGSIYII